MSQTSYGRFPDRMMEKRTPIPEDADEIKDLLIFQMAPMMFGSESGLAHNDAVREAFKRGYESGYYDRSRETFG